MGLGVHDGGLQRNDRDITWILLGGRAAGYFAVLSVNVYEGSEMSEFYTLKELNLDAARYRWVRDNLSNLWWDSGWCGPKPEDIDSHIDKELARDE